MFRLAGLAGQLTDFSGLVGWRYLISFHMHKKCCQETPRAVGTAIVTVTVDANGVLMRYDWE